MVSKNFIILFIVVIVSFSFFAYKPVDVVIAGPQMTDLEYFLDELKVLYELHGWVLNYMCYMNITFWSGIRLV